MFEDSTFESAGRINKASKSKYWMMVTFITNGSILLLLILIPLIYPEALPHKMMVTVLTAPPPPPPAPPPTAPARTRGSRGARAVGDDEQPADGSHQDPA